MIPRILKPLKSDGSGIVGQISVNNPCYVKPIKFSNLHESVEVYFLTDLHFNHDKEFMYGALGFTSYRERDAALVELIQERIHPDSIVIIAGDTMMGNGGPEALKEALDLIPGCLLFVAPGNHYAGYIGLFSDPEVENTRYISIPNYQEFLIRGKLVSVSHYPQSIWNKCHKGSYNICGHSHGSYPPTSLNTLESRSIDVSAESIGLDNFPASMSWLRSVLKDKDYTEKDHHQRDSDD